MAEPVTPAARAASAGGVAPLLKLLAECTAVVDSLELLARAARSHREKCAVLLGAALNSKLALEQVAEVAVSLDAPSLLQLRRVCASLLAALRLGETRVKLYGRCVCSLCMQARAATQAAPRRAAFKGMASPPHDAPR